MSAWLGHIGRAISVGLTWAVLWAPLGVLVGMTFDPNDTMDEPWLALGAYPGFLCGVVFCAVLGIAARHRALATWPLSRVAAWGAASSLLVMAPIFTGLLGTPNTDHAFWRWRFSIFAAVVLLSSISAVGSVLVMRWHDSLRAKRSDCR
jgi:hypothetical protein